MQVVVFELSGQLYAVDINFVREIIRSEKPHILPGMNGFLEGVIRLREKVIPVVNLGTRLNLLHNNDTLTRERIIIVDTGEEVLAGLLVDAVQEVIDVRPEVIQPSPALTGGESACLQGIALIAEKMIMLLDVQKMFLAQEKNEFMALADSGLPGQEVANFVQ